MFMQSLMQFDLGAEAWQVAGQKGFVDLLLSMLLLPCGMVWLLGWLID